MAIKAKGVSSIHSHQDQKRKLELAIRSHGANLRHATLIGGAA